MMYFQLRRTSLQRLNNVSLQCLGKQSRIIFLRTAMTAAGSELPERLRRPDAGTNRNAGKFYGKRSLKRRDMPFAPGKGEVFSGERVRRSLCVREYAAAAVCGAPLIFNCPFLCLTKAAGNGKI